MKVLLFSVRAKAYNDILPALSPLVEALKVIGKIYNATPAQIAIAWAIAKGTLPIIGVTKCEQVEKAYAAMQLSLTQDEVEKLSTPGDEIGAHTLREWERDMD